MTMTRWYKIFDDLLQAEKMVPLNHIQLIVAKGKKVCLIHSKYGFSVADDLCPHLGESLSKGTINFLNEIICPLHHYRFNLIDGKECGERARDLTIHKVKHNTSGFYIGIDDD